MLTLFLALTKKNTLVFVHSAHYKKYQTGWLINNGNLFLTVLEAEVQDEGAACPGEARFQAADSLRPDLVEEAKQVFRPPWPHRLPEAPPPNAITLGIRIST